MPRAQYDNRMATDVRVELPITRTRADVATCIERHRLEAALERSLAQAGSARAQQVALGVRDDVDHLIEHTFVCSVGHRDRQVLREQRDHVAKPRARVE